MRLNVGHIACPSLTCNGLFSSSLCVFFSLYLPTNLVCPSIYIVYIHLTNDVFVGSNTQHLHYLLQATSKRLWLMAVQYTLLNCYLVQFYLSNFTCLKRVRFSMIATCSDNHFKLFYSTPDFTAKLCSSPLQTSVECTLCP